MTSQLVEQETQRKRARLMEWKEEVDKMVELVNSLADYEQTVAILTSTLGEQSDRIQMLEREVQELRETEQDLLYQLRVNLNPTNVSAAINADLKTIDRHSNNLLHTLGDMSSDRDVQLQELQKLKLNLSVIE